jgi:hypothetical protein
MVIELSNGDFLCVHHEQQAFVVILTGIFDGMNEKVPPTCNGFNGFNSWDTVGYQRFFHPPGDVGWFGDLINKRNGCCLNGDSRAELGMEPVC